MSAPLPPTPPDSAPSSPVFLSRSPSPSTSLQPQDGHHDNGAPSSVSTYAIQASDASRIREPYVSIRPTHLLPGLESSNLPGLRRKHVTEGYRAGVATGRDDETKAQMGFDEGYPVGAALGMRVGFLLGMGEMGKAVPLWRDGRSPETRQGVAERLEVGELMRAMEKEGLIEREVKIEDLHESGGEAGSRPEHAWALPDDWMGRLAPLSEESDVIKATAIKLGIEVPWAEEVSATIPR